MILIDANILIYSVNRNAPQHAAAKSWLESAIASRETIGLPWIVLLAFLRLTTRPGLFQTPLPLDAALDLVDAWLEQPSVTLVHPGPRHARMLRDLLVAFGTGGNLTSDAHLAAIALEHVAELCSAARDYARFKNRKWRSIHWTGSPIASGYNSHMSLVDEARLDRSVFEVASLDDEDPDRAYWQSKSPQERMEALGLLRQIIYGYDPATTRLQRVLEVAELE